ncbi:DUF2953 domain-containing protein [Methanomethylovorans sp.]|uniref:DUF2953 domain-containing protein n=1 Tax=Methanomethylovorans sp. TaxID=2758717 RepID=UPI00351C27B7
MILEIIILLLALLILLVLFVSFHVLLEADRTGKQAYYKVMIKWLFLSYTINTGMTGGPDEPVRGEIIGETVPCRVRESAPSRKWEKDVSEGKILGAGPTEAQKTADEEIIGLKEEGKKKWTFRKIVNLARMLLSPLLRLVEDVLKAIHIAEIKCNILYGFDNPADTGIASGYVYAVRGYLNTQFERVRLYAEPTFTEEKMDMHMLADVSFRIVNLLPALVTFIMNRDVRRISWALIRKKELPG